MFPDSGIFMDTLYEHSTNSCIYAIICGVINAQKDFRTTLYKSEKDLDQYKALNKFCVKVVHTFGN